MLTSGNKSEKGVMIMEDFLRYYLSHNREVNEMLRRGEYRDDHSVYIERVLHDEPATVMFFSDGTKTVAICGKDEVYDREKGILVCLAKRLISSKNMNYILHEFSKDEYAKKQKEEKKIEAKEEK